MRQLKVSKQITNRDQKSLDNYFSEISKIGLISADEEIKLAERIRSGDSLALDKLVKANLRFVISVAKQYQSTYMTLGDLISEGNIGLIKAASKFDETRGFKFISYAVWWIRQSIMQALAEKSRMVRLPLNRVTTIRKISKAASDLEQVLEREPTSVELAEITELLPEEIDRNESISKRHQSFDAPLGNNEGSSLLEVIGNPLSELPDAGLMHESLTEELRVCLKKLTDRESQVISMYYGLNGHPPKSLSDIAARFDLTRERIRQIKEKATKKIKKRKDSLLLRSCLG